MKNDKDGKRNCIGKKLSLARHGLGLTQKEFRALLLETYGLSFHQTHYSDIEKYRRPVFDFQLKAFAKALGVNIEDLYDDE